MVINKGKYFSHSLIFRTPFKTAKNTFSERKVFYLKLSNEKNNFAFGEASPLPEFGTESFVQTENVLNNFCLDISEKQIRINSLNNISEISSHYSQYPSAKFAIEQALINLIVSENSSIINDLPQIDEKKIININCLLGSDDFHKTCLSADKYYQNGHRTFKIKFGINTFLSELKVVDYLRQRYSDKIKIRIDVNGKWNYDETKLYIEKLQEYNLEYIEQPVLNSEELIKLSNASNIVIAADESARSLEETKLLIENGIKAIIIKPTICGGFFNSLELINLCKKNNVKAVISSSFESNLGTNLLVMLSSIVSGNHAHGLGVGQLLTNHIFEGNFPVENGEIHIKNKNQFFSINQNIE